MGPKKFEYVEVDSGKIDLTETGNGELGRGGRMKISGLESTNIRLGRMNKFNVERINSMLIAE